jgi:hypothetical protein
MHLVFRLGGWEHRDVLHLKMGTKLLAPGNTGCLNLDDSML